MTSKLSKPTTPHLPYRKILPDGFVCPSPEFLRESMLQAEPISTSDHLLRAYFAGQAGVLVDSGGFVFYDPSDLTRRRVRPDVYIVLGVDTESILGREGYVVHEAGKPPDFALEVASRTTRRRDTQDKRVLYAEIGMGEYWRFDPTGGRWYGYPLAGDVLSDGEYRPIELTAEPDGMLWGYSPALDLCLCAQGRQLRYYDRKTQSYLLGVGEERAAHQETAAERDAERAARLQAASERDAERAARLRAASELDVERGARQESEAEIERLREQLRLLQGE